MSETMEQRILGAIARTRVERERPAAILRAIGEAGYRVVKLDRDAIRQAVDDHLWAGRGSEVDTITDAVMAELQSGDLDPIDPATEG